MGLFEDDFYSTKVTSWSEAPLLSRKWSVRRWLILLIIAGLVGAIMMLAIVSMVGMLNPKNSVVTSEPNVQHLSIAELATGYHEYKLQIINEVKPAVVGILGKQNNFFDEPYATGYGSGVIIRKDDKYAYIITNHHVVEDTTELEIILLDGRRKIAELVGKDQITDLAILKIPNEGIETVAEFGDSDLIREGETAIAIGHPLGIGYSPTITQGVVSAPLRLIPVSTTMDDQPDWEMEVIQTDAAINEGNSGGPLINLEGKVIGINSMKVAELGVEGIGFAIPVNSVQPIALELMNSGNIARPYMGIRSIELTPYLDEETLEKLKLPQNIQAGLIVVEALGPAEEAGLQTNDVIVALDDQDVDGILSLRKYIYNEKSIGDRLNVSFYRAGKKKTITMILAANEESP